MTHDLFVSYSRRDEAAVLDLVARVQTAGLSVWIDQAGIAGASRWREEIVSAIQASRAVVLFLSSSAAGSDNVVKEISLASEEGKPILPVHLGPVETPPSLKYQLAGLQHIAWYRGTPE